MDHGKSAIGQRLKVNLDACTGRQPAGQRGHKKRGISQPLPPAMPFQKDASTEQRQGDRDIRHSDTEVRLGTNPSLPAAR